MRSESRRSSATHPNAADEARLLARHLARVLPHALNGSTGPVQRASSSAAHAQGGNGSQQGGSPPPFAPWAASLFERHDGDAARVLELELADLVSAHSEIEALARAASGHGRRAAAARRKLVALLGEILSDPDSHARPVLWALLSEAPEQTVGRPGGSDARPSVLRRTTERIAGAPLRRAFAASIMTMLIGVAVLVVYLTVWGGPSRLVTPEDASVAALKVFLVWTLSFLPGWLYVRFLGQRASALWDEYVIHLHRLALDRPEYLPRPPRSSEYYEEWLDAGGYLQSDRHNIYRLKFNAYYGPSVADSGDSAQASFTVKTETMFPVFLTTALLAASWSAVLWDTSFATAPSSVWDLLKYAFLGAYAYTAQSLVRRFFQSDLRPSAYAGVVLRLIVVLAATLALHQMLQPATSMTTQAAVAFVVGIFPAIALQALQKAAATVLRVVVPQTSPEYPLNQLDGVNVWYEARLLEEGIEDMQNLATANLVDVMLHTRVPVGRLVDWIDQALLYLHLDRTERSVQEHLQVRPSKHSQRPGETSAAPEEAAPVDVDTAAVHPDDRPVEPAEHSRVRGSLNERSRAGTRSRIVLRQLGIRTATDLLKAFPPDDIDPLRTASDPALPQAEHLMPDGVDGAQLRTLVRVLAEDTRLAPVWSWQRRGALTRPEDHRRSSLAGRTGR